MAQPHRLRLRLNPFALPSSTDSSFLMLMVSAIGASMVIYWLLHQTLPPTGEFWRAQYSLCQKLFDPMAFLAPGVEQMERMQAHSDCTRAADMVGAGAMLGGVMLMLVVAFALYWTAPARKMRRERLQVLVAEDAP